MLNQQRSETDLWNSEQNKDTAEKRMFLFHFFKFRLCGNFLSIGFVALQLYLLYIAALADFTSEQNLKNQMKIKPSIDPWTL